MTIKRKTSAGREHSLAELRQINNRTLENHNKLNQIIDLRQQELGKMRDQLYVEVQNFREAHQAEMRRSAEVAMELATKSLPWWKRSRANIFNRAQEVLTDVLTLTKQEATRVKLEVEAENAKEQAEQARLKLQMEADQAALAKSVAEGKTPVEAANEL